MDENELRQQLKPFGIVLFFLALVVALSTIFFHFVEGWRWLDAYYYTIVTIATVGYGDITPQTDVGKIGTTFVILIGIGIFSTFVGMLVKRRALKRFDRKKPDSRADKKTLGLH